MRQYLEDFCFFSKKIALPSIAISTVSALNSLLITNTYLIYQDWNKKNMLDDFYDSNKFIDININSGNLNLLNFQSTMTLVSYFGMNLLSSSFKYINYPDQDSNNLMTDYSLSNQARMKKFIKNFAKILPEISGSLLGIICSKYNFQKFPKDSDEQRFFYAFLFFSTSMFMKSKYNLLNYGLNAEQEFKAFINKKTQKTLTESQHTQTDNIQSNHVTIEIKTSPRTSPRTSICNPKEFSIPSPIKIITKI